jgi:signal transduction histidine kinase
LTEAAGAPTSLGAHQASSALPPAPLIEVAVQDRGLGVPPEHREGIFERFYRAPPGASLRSGFGLGLYFARQMAERHGGSLVGEWPEEGGSRFLLRLPVRAAEAP